jgi:hypothetical protein
MALRARIANSVELSRHWRVSSSALLDTQPLSSIKGLLGAGNRGVGGLDSASFEDDWSTRRSGYGNHGCPPGVGAKA